MLKTTFQKMAVKSVSKKINAARLFSADGKYTCLEEEVLSKNASKGMSLIITRSRSCIKSNLYY